MQDPIPLIVKRWIEATPERLYQAFQDARSLPQWFIPDRAVGLEVKAYDFTEGGHYMFRYHMPDGRRPVVTGQFTGLSDPVEISFSWNWQSPDPFEDIPMHVHFGFVARDGGTDVTITHTGIPTHMACALHENGWEGTLHHLEQYVLQISKTEKERS